MSGLKNSGKADKRFRSSHRPCKDKGEAQAYNKLVLERKACRACEGLVNPADYTYDSDQIGPWSLWQGNLDSDLIIVGQDWGDTRYFEKWEGRDQQTGNPTNCTKIPASGCSVDVA